MSQSKGDDVSKLRQESAGQSDAQVRAFSLELTHAIITTCTRLENALGWEPWQDPPELEHTLSERIEICKQLKELVASLYSVQGATRAV